SPGPALRRSTSAHHPGNPLRAPPPGNVQTIPADHTLRSGQGPPWASQSTLRCENDEDEILSTSRNSRNSPNRQAPAALLPSRGVQCRQPFIVVQVCAGRRPQSEMKASRDNWHNERKVASATRLPGPLLRRAAAPLAAGSVNAELPGHGRVD